MRHPRSFPLAVTLALAATALMTVHLPSWDAKPDLPSSQGSTLEQSPAEDASVERVAPEPRGRPVVIAMPTPTPTEEPTASPAVAPVPVVVAAALVVAPRIAPTAAPPPPATCPASFFCYPRLGIAEAIVPYSDCSGTTDVGTSLRQLTCVRDGIWLAGHAYTQFGGITAFRIGDVVFVRGQRFEITGSSVQRACAPSTVATAPLSLQTSLDATACGRVLVVQGR